MDKGRRYFLRRGFAEFCGEVYNSFLQESKTEAEKEADSIDRFFSSWSSCQAFLSEYTMEELQEDARRVGIDCTDLSKRELARKLAYKEKNL